MKKHNETSIKVMLNLRNNSRDGRYTLIIQLLRERKRGVIFTTYRLLPEEFNKKRQKAVALSQRKADKELAKEVNFFLEKQIEEIQRVITELDRDGKASTVGDIVHAYRQRYDNRYIHTFFLSQIEYLKKVGSQGTAANYQSTLIAFEKFLGGRRTHFDSVDTAMLMSFERHLQQISLQPNTITFYMSNLRAVYNKAQKMGYVLRGASPFDDVSIRISKTRKLAVGIDTIRQIATADLSSKPILDMARNLFMFSFYCRGMSFVDIAYLRLENIKGGAIHYCRRKTGQLYTIKIIPALQELIDRYSDPRSAWVLPVMTSGLVQIESEVEQYKRYRYALSKHLRSFKKLSKLLQLNDKISFNMGRHTWASIANENGVPVSVISVGLGHTSEKTTHIYLDELDNRKIDEANELVAGLLDQKLDKKKE